MKGFKVLPLVLLSALVGCDIFGGSAGGNQPPEITAFTADPGAVASAGDEVVLSWTVTGAVSALSVAADTGAAPGTVSGTSVAVYPRATTTYTLTASNGSAQDEATATVTVGTTPEPPGDDTTAPTGLFGVAATADAETFLSDQDGGMTGASDERVLHLEPGGTFYVEATYSDPGGITNISVLLANSAPEGLRNTLVQGQSVGGFTLVGPVGDCDLAAAPRSVSCVYQISVGSDVVNIDKLANAGSEFAYVFRANVTDGQGNTSDEPPRGYVTVGPYPLPPNEAPIARFTATPSGTTVNFDASASSDPEGGALTYAWAFGDGSVGSGATIAHTYAGSGSYPVTLTVTDPVGGTGSSLQPIVVGN